MRGSCLSSQAPPGFQAFSLSSAIPPFGTQVPNQPSLLTAGDSSLFTAWISLWVSPVSLALPPSAPFWALGSFRPASSSFLPWPHPQPAPLFSGQMAGRPRALQSYCGVLFSLPLYGLTRGKEGPILHFSPSLSLFPSDFPPPPVLRPQTLPSPCVLLTSVVGSINSDFWYSNSGSCETQKPLNLLSALKRKGVSVRCLVSPGCCRKGQEGPRVNRDLAGMSCIC